MVILVKELHLTHQTDWKKRLISLTAQDDGQNKQFKPKIFQSKRRGQMRNLYDKHNYD